MSTFAAPASATSGLQGYHLEGAEKPKEKRTLYIKRAVRNGGELVKWAKEAGFPTALPEDDLHVTIAYSKTAVDWDTIPRSDLPLLRIVGGERKLKRLGKTGEAAVLGIESDELTRRWGDIHAAGAVWSWPSYQPHITISYAADAVDFDSIVPPGEVIELGPEQWSEVKENWMASVVEKQAPVMAAGIAIVTDEGMALFLKRGPDGDHAGEWCFPGGHIEDGETAEDAAWREAREEIGLERDPAATLVKIAQIANSDVDFTTFFLRAEAQEKPRLNEEHTAFVWAPVDQPPSPLHPGVRATLPLVISQATETTMKAAGCGATNVANPDAGENIMNLETVSLFAQITKVDAIKRIVYGTAVVEEIDRANEIFDYASSKPEFEKWSAECAKSTDGKSLGNVRAMHQPIAAGKLVDISFDDARKAIEVGAKIVDDNEWKKVEEGVYTGFSIGGKYLKKWQDGESKRYTAAPGEISIVDRPCGPSAMFSMIKADGTEEMRKFAAPAEPAVISNEAIAVRATELAKAAGKASDWLAHIEPARRALEAEALAKADPVKDEVKDETVEKGDGAVTQEPEIVDTEVNKGDEITPEVTDGETVAKTDADAAGDAKVTPDDIEQVWVSKRLPNQSFAKKSDLTKALVELDLARAADAVIVVEDDAKGPMTKADLEVLIKAYTPGLLCNVAKRDILKAARRLEALDLLPEGMIAAKAAADTDELKKAASLYFVSNLLHMLACVEGMEEEAEFTALFGGVAVPKELTDRFGSALVELGDIVASILDLVLGAMSEEERNEASKAVEFTDLIKRGARHNAKDKAVIKTTHDAMVKMDASCCSGAAKADAVEGLAKVTEENTLLKAAIEAVKEAAKNDKDDLLKTVKAGMEHHSAALKAEVIAEVTAQSQAEIDGLRKNLAEMEKALSQATTDLATIRYAPALQFTGRVVEKTIPIEVQQYSAEELRKRGDEAHANRFMGSK